MQPLWCKFISNKVSTDPRVLGSAYALQTSEEWANEQVHTHKKRAVNCKAGIYVCSELWKPQGQIIYMRSTVSVCLCVNEWIFFLPVFIGKGVWQCVHVCMFVDMCNWGGTVRCQNTKWSTSLVVCGICHCANQLQKRCWGRPENHRGGFKKIK